MNCAAPALLPSANRPVLTDGQGKPFGADLIANTYSDFPEGVLVYRPSQLLHPRDAYGSLLTATEGLRLTTLRGEPPNADLFICIQCAS